LARRHDEPGRYYHTLRHISDALTSARVLAGRGRERPREEATTGPPPTCLLAIFFHDAVYDTRASDNEDRSALLATEVLAMLGCPGPEIGAVARMVRATAGHLSSAPDEALVNDADLRILARPAAAYDVYVRRVRREYAWVPDEQWATARAQLLRHLLDRPIYVTPWAARNWEPAARRNLRRELASLDTQSRD
jgi:predicted metal-dependent HD superfamily phosphohydrolase